MCRKLAAVVSVLSWVVGATVSCEVANDNDVECNPVACTSACEELGYPSGTCADDACTCQLSDTDPYRWDGGADAGAGTARHRD